MRGTQGTSLVLITVEFLNDGLTHGRLMMMISLTDFTYSLSYNPVLHNKENEIKVTAFMPNEVVALFCPLLHFEI